MKGKGHIGSFCPCCDGDFEYSKYDVDGEFYWEYWRCSECEAVYFVLFKAIEWEQMENDNK